MNTDTTAEPALYSGEGSMSEAYLWSPLLRAWPLPPIPEHNLTVYVWDQLPGLEVHNVKSENRSEVNIVNADSQVDPDLIYIDISEEQKDVKKSITDIPAIELHNGVHFVSLYPEQDEQDNTITPVETPCIVSESGFNFCSIYDDCETADYSEESTAITPVQTPCVVSEGRFNFCSIYYDCETADSSEDINQAPSTGITPVQTPCIVSEGGFNFCSIYDDCETAESSEDINQTPSTVVSPPTESSVQQDNISASFPHNTDLTCQGEPLHLQAQMHSLDIVSPWGDGGAPSGSVVHSGGVNGKPDVC